MNEAVWIVVALLIFGLVVATLVRAARRRRSDALQRRFGPEYAHQLAEQGDRRAVERELARRQHRFGRLELRTLHDEERQRLASRWQQVQLDFIDHPRESVAAADDLVAEVMQARGYPTGDLGQRVADVSCETPEVAADYRRASELAERSSRGVATTEDLRQATVHYRRLLAALLEGEAESPRRARKAS